MAASFALLLGLIAVFPAYSLDVSHYAQNSVLSSGRWVKIKVSKAGMQLVSDSELKTMGFSDPSKVNVYGTGGRMLSEELSEENYDDLPLLPSVRDRRGLLFYAVDNIRWNSSSRRSSEAHELNPYCSDSYYFLSDREAEVKQMPKADTRPGKSGMEYTTYTHTLLHERNLQAPSDCGRMLFGEDFRSKRTQSFDFELPGRAGGVSTDNVSVKFATKTKSGSSIITLKSGDSRSSFTVPACTEQFIMTSEGNLSLQGSDGKISVSVDFNGGGAIFTARLDYIKVNYQRRIELTGGEIHFYDNFNRMRSVSVGGCTAETRIWDVTDPCRPQEVEYELSGNTAHFVPTGGWREYVAFDPSSAGASVSRVGMVANQDIHSMESPDMVIISPALYMNAAKKLALLHEEADGMKVHILTPEDVYNEFSGGHPDVLAFRRLLKMWYDRPGERKIRYCMLMGRGSYDSQAISSGVAAMGYKPLPMWQSPTGDSEVLAYSTDDIIGQLEDCTLQDYNIEGAAMQVAVGRLPVKTAREADLLAEKIDRYVRKPNYGEWRNNVMIIADDSDNSIHFDQSQDIYAIFSRKAPHFQYERLYFDAYNLEYTSVGQTYPAAKERMMKRWNEGVVYTNYIGHASWSSMSHEKMLTWEDINSFTNENPFFFYGATCGFGFWDGDNVSAAEILLLNPKAGTIGSIIASRTVYMTPNGELNRRIAEWLFSDDGDGNNLRVGDAFVKGKNGYYNGNKLRYCLMSDPALRLPKPGRTVDITSINGASVSGSGDFQEVTALSRVELKGTVCRSDGAIDTDFNGTMQISLYDAERPIETNGNGETGKVEIYNDRKTRLNLVAAKVTGGEWTATLNIPAEIENNYSPARIVAYAYSNKGEEAHGSTEQLYVYGFPEEESADTEGPKIESIYLNHPGFRAGEMVNSCPVVHIRVSDESGINVSDYGVGHKMLITLDGKRIFDDVNTYYQPDTEDPTAGTVVYPLPELESGEHRLGFTVYDNANNCSIAELEFGVGAVRDPVIRNLGTDVNPASTAVVFSLEIDHPNTDMKCMLEVFDLSGRKVWMDTQNIRSNMRGGMEAGWDLRDGSGRRVPRGIYLYRATVETPEGRYSSQTRKLAVTAQ